MVWPPPKVLKSPEGEVSFEPPRGGTPEMSAVVAGVGAEGSRSASATPPGPTPLPPVAFSPALALPGGTVSVMAATSVPRDWLEHPEGLIGCVLGSRYRITNLIGRGPMGIACEGESSRGRQVTLKLLPRAPELPIEHFAWQVRQALALAHFDHPNVAPINDFGALEDGSAFVSRARVPGVTLRALLRQGALPIGRALDIARQVAAALATAHVQDIAHGRLKPENILLQGGARPGDVVKVVDFGMAGLPVNLRAVAPSEDEARRLALRTRLYLPAEVTGASPAIDVYSLGVILFEMIAGQPPFALESLHPSRPQPAPLGFAQINPSLVVPPTVSELVFSLVHPQAAERGLAADRVGEFLDGLLGRPSIGVEPVTAQMPSAPRQPAHGLDASSLLAKVGAAEMQAFAVPNAASLVWPSSPAPAPDRSHSFPPLPRGFSGSTFPPPAIETTGRAPLPTPSPPVILPVSGPPAALPSTAPRAPLPSGMPLPPSRRAASVVDEPFATHSFPPPQIIIPQQAAVPSFPEAASSPATSDDLDMDLRPSFIGRLKRLFGKKPPDAF